MMPMFSLIVLFADVAAAEPAPKNPTAEMIKFAAMVGVFILMFYFVAIRPQSKKAKEHATLLKSLRSNDKVVTSGGLLGVVLNVKEKSVTVRCGESKLELQKGAIAEVLERGSDSSQS
jgi:preprotein translocase subunit YajC